MATADTSQTETVPAGRRDQFACFRTEVITVAFCLDCYHGQHSAGGPHGKDHLSLFLSEKIQNKLSL